MRSRSAAARRSELDAYLAGEQNKYEKLLSAVREADGKEELHLLMLDDSVPAGSRLC